MQRRDRARARSRKSDQSDLAKWFLDSVSSLNPSVLTQQFFDISLFVLQRDSQWCLTVVIALIDIHSVIDQKLRELDKTISGGLVQRAPAVLTAAIHVCAARQI